MKEKHRRSNATKITALKRILHLMMLVQLTTVKRNHVYPIIGSVRGSGALFVTGCLQLIAVIGSF